VPAVDGIWLGGGYPEAHAAALAANAPMRASIRSFALQGGPVYAECGGLMYLARSIRTLDGRSHEMAGVLDGEAVMKEKLVALGYVEVETRRATVLGAAGLRFRGHQFRHSELELASGAPTPDAYTVRRRHRGETSREGHGARRVLASYVHAHWASNPQAPKGFVASCAAFASRGADTR
jgi:cobyrinic acid a,c-diamide synthase